MNLIPDRYDLAIRMGSVPDSELMSRRLAEVEVVLVASPVYVARAGVPACPDDLSHFDAIAIPLNVTKWRVTDREVVLSRRFATSFLPAARMAALSGLGIARLPLFVVARDLAAGDLVRVLPDAELPRFPATALYPRAVTPSMAVRLLLDDLTAG